MITPQEQSFDPTTTFLVSRDGIATAEVNQTPINPVPVDAEKGSGTTLLRIARRLAADAFWTQPLTGKAHLVRVIKIPANLAAIDGFSRIALSCLDQIQTSAQLLRQGSNADGDMGRDREALHQTRVGLRRLRAAFTAFKGVLLPGELENWKKEARWLAGELNCARDLDVFIEHVSSLTGKKKFGDDQTWALFGSRLLMMRAAAYEQALAAIASQRFAAFIGDGAKRAGDTTRRPTADAETAILRDGNSSVLARQTLSRLHHRLRKAGVHLTKLDPAGRHVARISAKKLRYTAEFFGKTFDKTEEMHCRRYVRSLGALQEILGRLNDLAMVEKCACAVAGHSAELAFHAGQIIGDQRAEQGRLLAKAARAYGRWREAKLFWR
jgi:triphosphatase